MDLIFGISTPPFLSSCREKSVSSIFAGLGLVETYFQITPTATSIWDQGRGAGFGMEDMDKLRHDQGGDRSFAAPHSQNTGLLSPRRRVATR